MPDKVDIFGVPVDNVTMDEALARAVELAQGDGCSYAVTPNAEMIYAAMHNPAVKAALCGADLILPDGAGVVMAAKKLKRPLKEKVAGIVFGEKLLPLLAERGLSLFILGCQPGVALTAADRLTVKYPGLIIVGVRDGFSDHSEDVAAVNAAGCDVLYIAMGAPYSELWMAENKDKVCAKFMVALGGSIDYYAGIVKRTPAIFIKLRLEWFHRLCKQPSRIKRMTALPKFMSAIRKQARLERRAARKQA